MSDSALAVLLSDTHHVVENISGGHPFPRLAKACRALRSASSAVVAKRRCRVDTRPGRLEESSAIDTVIVAAVLKGWRYATGWRAQLWHLHDRLAESRPPGWFTADGVTIWWPGYEAAVAAVDPPHPHPPVPDIGLRRHLGQVHGIVHFTVQSSQSGRWLPVDRVTTGYAAAVAAVASEDLPVLVPSSSSNSEDEQVSSSEDEQDLSLWVRARLNRCRECMIDSRHGGLGY